MQSKHIFVGPQHLLGQKWPARSNCSPLLGRKRHYSEKHRWYPFSQHFFDKWKFCLGSPFRNTSEKIVISWSENIEYGNIIYENINYFAFKYRFRPRISTWDQIWNWQFINLGHFWHGPFLILVNFFDPSLIWAEANFVLWPVLSQNFWLGTLLTNFEKQMVVR